MISRFFLVIIRLLRERSTPQLFFRLQALSPDLLLQRARPSNYPSDSKLHLLMPILNYHRIAKLHLTLITTQLHAMVSDIESVGETAIFTPGDPDSYWYDRFGSLRPSFPSHVTLTRTCRHFPAAHFGPRSRGLGDIGGLRSLLALNDRTISNSTLWPSCRLL